MKDDTCLDALALAMFSFVVNGKLYDSTQKTNVD